MVIVRAAEQLDSDGPEILELIANEIARLIEDGRLEAVGDIANWRRSEVRLAPD